MFFEEEILADILTCPKCEKKYRDPRLLPCGETLCNKCIIVKTDSQNNQGYECDFCNLWHQIVPPMQSFPTNKPLKKLIDQENLRISHSHLVKQLKTLLNTLKISSDELNAENINCIKTIKDFFTQTRSEVVKTGNSAISNIQKQSEELIIKIDKYESKCLQICDDTKQNNGADLTHILSEAEVFQNKWSEYINHQIVRESQIRQALEEAFFLIQEIDKKFNILKQTIFDDELFSFSPNQTQTCSIGNIRQEKISDCFLELDKFKKIDLKNKLNRIDHIYYESVYIHNFANGKFLFAYPIGPFNIKLSMVDQDQVVRVYELIQPVNQFKKAIYKEKIFLFFSYGQKLRCLDKDFHIECEGNVGSEVLSMAATNMYLFCLIEDNMILKFNHKLNLLQKIKINEENLDGLVHYMNKYDKLRSYREKIFLSRPNSILSINFLNLSEFKKLAIKEKKFVFFNHKIVALNSETNQIIFYDLHGMVIQKQHLNNACVNDLVMIESENFDKISFFDCSKYILFSYINKTN